MQLLLSLYFGKLVVFAMVLSRIAAMTMLVPIFGSRTLPLHLRIMIAVVLSVLVAPIQWQVGVAIPSNHEILVGLLVNILIGASLGLAVLALFSGFTLAGGLIAQGGMAITPAQSADPLSPHSPVTVRILQVLALAIFVALGGHRLLMMSILDSFQALPATGTALPGGMLETITRLLSESFRMAVRVAAPVVTAVLAATLLIGLASRAIPQLNSFTMGFTVNLWVTFLGLLFSLAAIGHLFGDKVTHFISIWQQSF